MKTSVLIVVVMAMMMLVMSSSAAAVAVFFLWTPPTTPPAPIAVSSPQTIVPVPQTTPPPAPIAVSSPQTPPPSFEVQPPPNPNPKTKSQPIIDPKNPARELLEPHNAYRRTHGVPELLWSDEIAAVAQRNVDWQSSQGVWGHQAWDAGMIPRDMGIGAENSAGGTDDLTNRWYRSPGHQANMLNPEATHMGCGLSFVNLPQSICIFAKQ